MQRYVTFRSLRFELEQEHPEAVNEGCFGQDVAAWLRPFLDAGGFQPSEPIAEDYGWGVWTTVGGDPYWLAITGMPPREGDEARGGDWAICIAYDPGFDLLKRVFHRPRPADLMAIARAVHAALSGDPGITDVAWWGEEPERGEPGAAP